MKYSNQNELADLTPVEQRPLLLWRHVAVGTVYLALFVGLDRMVLFLPTSYEAPAWYPPTALSVALVLGLGVRYAPLLALGWILSAAVNYRAILFTNNSLTNAVWFALAYSVAAAVLRRMKVDCELKKLRSLGLFLLVTFLADGVGAVTGVLGLMFDGFVRRNEYWPTVVSWWFGDAIVIAGITPFLLLHIIPWVKRFLRGDRAATMINELRPHAVNAECGPVSNGGAIPGTIAKSSSWENLEPAAMGASVVLSIWLAFAYQLSQHLDLLYVCFLPVVWIGMRRGLGGVATGLVGIGVIPLLALRSTSSDPRSFLTVQLLLLLLSVSGLMLGALVSEREYAYESLAAVARRYRGLVEKSSESVLLLSANAEILFDEHRQQILGHRPEEFLGRSFFDFAHSSDVEKIRREFLRWMERPGATGVLECRARHNDSSFRWLEIVGTNWLSDPAIGAVVLNYRDITQRKAFEDALRQSEARYRELFENALFGVYRSTPDGRLIEVNSAFVRMFGYEFASEVKGMDAHAVFGTPSLPCTPQRYHEIHGSDFVELELKRKNGAALLASIHGREVRDSQGQLVFLEGFVEDVTERRQLEAQLRHSQKMEAIGRLAGGVAHDFNNLLCVILGYTDTIAGRLAPDSLLSRQTSEIKKAANRAAYLTRQLLAFGRKQLLRPQVMNLNHVVCSMSELLNRLIGENISLVTHLDPMLRNIRADISQLEQVIMNLAVNSRDAMPRGGKLIVETNNLDVASPSSNEMFRGQYACLRVSDTGVGMDEETQAHIFEPFFTTKSVDKGTGLGLATVYGIVQQSNGYISLQSAPGRGTSFELRFPAVAAPVEARTAPQITVPVPAVESTILLVEDEPALRQLIKEVLARQGYAVLEVSNGAAAIEIARSHSGPIHLLLTDFILPGMDGREIAEALQRMRPGIRVLFISGYTRETMFEQPEYAAIPLLHKPFPPHALVEKVHELLLSGPLQ